MFTFIYVLQHFKHLTVFCTSNFIWAVVYIWYIKLNINIVNMCTYFYIVVYSLQQIIFEVYHSPYNIRINVLNVKRVLLYYWKHDWFWKYFYAVQDYIIISKMKSGSRSKKRTRAKSWRRWSNRIVKDLTLTREENEEWLASDGGWRYLVDRNETKWLVDYQEFVSRIFAQVI